MDEDKTEIYDDDEFTEYTEYTDLEEEKVGCYFQTYLSQILHKTC